MNWHLIYDIISAIAVLALIGVALAQHGIIKIWQNAYIERNKFYKELYQSVYRKDTSHGS